MKTIGIGYLGSYTCTFGVWIRTWINLCLSIYFKIYQRECLAGHGSWNENAVL